MNAFRRLTSLLVAFVLFWCLPAYAGTPSKKVNKADAPTANTSAKKAQPKAPAVSAATRKKIQKKEGEDTRRAIFGNRGEGERAPGSTPAEERAAIRAYPAEEIPLAATQNAITNFAKLKSRSNRGNRTAGVWQLLGPEYAIQPAVLSFNGTQYVASGRTTAMAIAPTCTPDNCRLWIGAAGGGVWRTDKALAGSPKWTPLTDGMPSNAIGSIYVDTNDASGNTIYVGTGEANASGDSEAGVGIFKSTNGGNTWTVLAGSTQFYGRAISAVVVDPTDPNVIYAGVARATRGISSVTGGSTTNPPVAVPFGVYKSTDGGATFNILWNAQAAGSLRGVTDIELDPADHNTIYAAAYQLGIWRSSPALDGDATFRQVYAASAPALNTVRIEFALTKKSGKTRIYAGDGSQGAPAAAVWRVDDADIPAAALLATQAGPGGWEQISVNTNGHPRYGAANYCTGQCWYDNDVATPPGRPDDVWVLGSYQYGEIGFRSNGRAVVVSRTAGDPDPANGDRTFTDLTWDAQAVPNLMHPDSQSIVFHPTNPDIAFLGSDGGVVRTSGTYVDKSADCDARAPFMSAASYATCKRMLSAVPEKIYNLNKGLSTLQFMSVAHSPTAPLNLLIGGTQDNGTWLYTGSGHTWYQTMYGDGGQSGIDAANGAMFNEFTGAATDTNFRGGDETMWVVTSGPLANSGEVAQFYSAIIADPAVSGTQFFGMNHVWRTKKNGGDQAYLEANCPEFTTSFANPACGDWEPLGGPNGAENPGSLTAAALGDRAGGNVAAVERTSSDSSTMWVATSTGRVFISKNADADPSGAVTYTRLDSMAANDPGRFVSGMWVDRADPNRAYLTYSGYSAVTPATPGHVFRVDYDPIGGTATWTSLDGAGPTAYPDLPATDVVRDDVTGDLYVSNDFGVLRLASGSSDWEVAGTGLPVVEVPGLSIATSARRLYAATHGRSVWSVALP